MQEMFSRFYDKIYDVCESILEEGIQQGVFKDIQKDTIARVIVSYVEGAGIQWHMHNHSFDLERHFELLTINLKNSILKTPESIVDK